MAARLWFIRWIHRAGRSVRFAEPRTRPHRLLPSESVMPDQTRTGQMRTFASMIFYRASSLSGELFTGWVKLKLKRVASQKLVGFGKDARLRRTVEDLEERGQAHLPNLELLCRAFMIRLNAFRSKASSQLH